MPDGDETCFFLRTVVLCRAVRMQFREAGCEHTNSHASSYSNSSDSHRRRRVGPRWDRDEPEHKPDLRREL